MPSPSKHDARHRARSRALLDWRGANGDIRGTKIGRSVAALGVAVCAFILYHATLVPGMDLGDSASFQTDAGSARLTPRQGYPLYFALNAISVRLLAPPGGEPARAANLTSAACGAAAAAVLTLVVSDLGASALAGVFAGLLFAASYTFWSQCVTAEVYALHMLCVGLTLLALRRWAGAPSRSRLAIALGVYAIAFGNHLSMILLAPAIVLFIGLSHPRRWRGLFDAPTVAVALAMAVVGAAQYAWNAAGMRAMPDVPQGMDAVRAFWFDVTKTDWRQSMVYATPANMRAERWAMYWFDLRQQFGAAAIAAAIAGAVALALRRPRDFVLVAGVFAANWLFAFTYNVGDVHVFFLPSHLMVAVAAGYAVAATIGALRVRGWRRTALAAGLIALLSPAWRAADTLPAVDRSDDRRGERVLHALAHDLASDRAIVFADMNWQLQNGLTYYGKYRQPDLQYLRVADRLFAFPQLADDNRAMGRRVYLTSEARRRVGGAYGDLFAIDPDPDHDAARIASIADRLPAGTPYVFCVLTPYRDRPIDPADPPRIVSILTGLDERAAPRPSLEGYSAIAGVKGTAPALVRIEPRPFRASAWIGAHRLVIRMDAWLAYDTIRRADFGHVIADRRHALGIDRGMSFVAWPAGADPIVVYESSLYAEQPRFVLRP